MTTKNQISTYCYDAAGNLLLQATCPTSPPYNYTYAYDAENHLSSTNGYTYLYDGDGRRVEKETGNPLVPYKLYYYGEDGQVWAETNGSGTVTDEYVYFDGSRIAHRDSGLLYLYAEDHLGSARAVIQSGSTSLTYDADFYPFGGERPVIIASDNNYKFTGKERDFESGLDYFGARFDTSSLGRFTIPDPLLSSAALANPQTWNRYAYAFNNPLRIVDPTGLFGWGETAGGDLSDEELHNIACDKHNKRRKWAENALTFREQFRNALEEADFAAGSSELSAAQQSAAYTALDAYGTENDSNGVIVGTERTSGASTLLNNDHTITVNFGSIRGDFLAATVGHEGTHVSQIQAWLNGGETSNGDLNHYAREAAAWAVGASIAQALGMNHLRPNGGGAEYDVWNKGWKTADVQTARSAAGIANILRYSNLKPTDMDTFSSEHHQ